MASVPLGPECMWSLVAHRESECDLSVGLKTSYHIQTQAADLVSVLICLSKNGMAFLLF